MAKVGRPPWQPPPLDKVEALASRGLTEEQIAHVMGICQDTLIEKKKQYPEFAEAIKKGQAKGISDIANALYQSAKNGNTTAQIFFLKARAKWREETAVKLSNDDDKPFTQKISHSVDERIAQMLNDKE